MSKNSKLPNKSSHEEIWYVIVGVGVAVLTYLAKEYIWVGFLILAILASKWIFLIIIDLIRKEAKKRKYLIPNFIDFLILWDI